MFPSKYSQSCPPCFGLTIHLATGKATFAGRMILSFVVTRNDNSHLRKPTAARPTANTTGFVHFQNTATAAANTVMPTLTHPAGSAAKNVSKSLSTSRRYSGARLSDTPER